MAGDLLVRGQRLIRGQPEADDRRGPGVLAPQLHAGIFLRLLPPLLGRGGVGFQHGAGDLGADLPGSLPVTRSGTMAASAAAAAATSRQRVASAMTCAL